jgi:hypothetical protein
MGEDSTSTNVENNSVGGDGGDGRLLLVIRSYHVRRQRKREGYEGRKGKEGEEESKGER